MQALGTKILDDLCINQWLLLSAWFSQALSSRSGSWHGFELLLRRSGEVLALVSRDILLLDRRFSLGDGRRDRAAAATDHLLSPGSVFSGVLLCGLSGSCDVLAGELLDLLSLLVDNIGGILKVVVDELLVRLVDERSEKEDRGRYQGKAPEWDDFD